jgi:glutathione S-transferase
MAAFIVHNIPGSPFGRAVCATLEEKGTDYRVARVAPETRANEPHISRHPFGRVPVLEHDGYLLYKTQAILRYLDRVLPAPALTPKDVRATARMDQVMNVSDWYLFQGVGNVIGFERVVKPRLTGQPADEAAIARAMPQAQRVLAELSRLLGGQSYFAGDALSLADIMVAPHLDFLRLTPEWATLSPAVPSIVRWLDRINARASFQATTMEKIAERAKAA